jgi:large subunit ribosomal protein L29
MKAKEMRERSAGELQIMEKELARELWKTRFNNFTNRLDDTAKLRRLRREIARIKTILTEKGAAQAPQKSE